MVSFKFLPMTTMPFFHINPSSLPQLTAVMSQNDPEKKRRDWAVEWGVLPESLATPHQVHSSTVLWADTPGEYPHCDGLITHDPEIMLSLQTADCVPVFLYDTGTHIRGLVHAGWRGTVDGIISNAVTLMRKHACTIENIQVMLGPAICKECYEVGEEVAVQFADPAKQKGTSGKWRVGLHEQICLQLVEAGIPTFSIQSSGICTFENANCCSYRRDGDRAGRMYSFLGVSNGYH